MLGLILCTLALGQTPVANPLLTPDQMKADLRIAHEIFDADDAGMYRYVSKDQLDLVWNKAEAQLNRPMNAFGFYRVLLPAVAAQKCGHSGIQLPKPLADDLLANRPLLPLFVKVLPSGAFVYRDLSKPGSPNDGARIQSINGVDIKKIVGTMMHSVCMDGDSTDGRRAKISGQQFCAYLVTLLGMSAPYQVEMRLDTGKSTTVSYDGLVMPEIAKQSILKNLVPDSDADPAWFKLTENGTVGVLRVTQFNDSEGHDPVRKVFESAFNALKDNHSKSLIIDVRDNGGGEDLLGQILLSYLETKPFKYYDHLLLNGTYRKSSTYTGDFSPPPPGLVSRQPDGAYEVTGHPNWGIKDPRQPHFGGKVFILANGNSFSTTCEFLSHIKSERLATIIGEDTGGNYYGNTSGFTTSVTLPNTKMRIRVPGLAYWITVDHRFPPASPIHPDIRLQSTIQDLVVGRDVQMDKALDLARKA